MSEISAFHEERRTGCGASDVAGIFSLSPWTTPYQIWMEKTGRVDPQESNLQMRFGTYAEEFVAREYADATGQRVQRFNAMMRHPDVPLIAHFDRLVVPAHAKRASHRRQIRTDLGLECKTAHALAASGDEWGDAGTDQILTHYLLQCAAYMAVSGCSRWDLAVLFGNADFRIYHLARDRSLERAILDYVDDWWTKHVVADVPPDPVSEAEARQRWAKHRQGKVVTLGHDEARRMQELAEFKRQIKTLEAKQQSIRDELVPLLEDADEIVGPDGNKLATYRANKDGKTVQWKSAFDHLALVNDIAPEAKQVAIATFTSVKPGPRVLRLAKDLSC